jgi:hypothetical protein
MRERIADLAGKFYGMFAAAGFYPSSCVISTGGRDPFVFLFKQSNPRFLSSLEMTNLFSSYPAVERAPWERARITSLESIKTFPATTMEMPTASKPFLLVRFLCGFNKENELGCRA